MSEQNLNDFSNTIEVAKHSVGPQNDLKPPLKWAGGKRWLVPHLLPIWRAHSQRRLLEPFCGGLAVALALKPSRALLNDINPHLINFYCWLKQGLHLEIPMSNDEDHYYRNRAQFNHLITSGQGDSKETAELFYYLNRTCYNGLCRFNRSGEFNVPFGRYKRISYRSDLASYSTVLRNWDFTAVDFEEIPLERDDFVYADPPYDVEFTQYAKEDFTWDDQVRLVKWLAKHRGPTVLSNQATNRIVELYREHGFSSKSFDAPRRISCTGDRSPAKEVLAVKGV